MASKKIRELYHYIILSIVLTLGVFLAYFLTTFMPFMDWVQFGNLFYKILSWICLSLIYFLIIFIILIPLDLLLHKIYRI